MAGRFGDGDLFSVWQISRVKPDTVGKFISGIFSAAYEGTGKNEGLTSLTNRGRRRAAKEN